MLRESDLHLPTKGWDRIVLAASAPAPSGAGPITVPPGRNEA